MQFVLYSAFDVSQIKFQYSNLMGEEGKCVLMEGMNSTSGYCAMNKKGRQNCKEKICSLIIVDDSIANFRRYNSRALLSVFVVGVAHSRAVGSETG
jgi:hypothetical protein